MLRLNFSKLLTVAFLSAGLIFASCLVEEDASRMMPANSSANTDSDSDSDTESENEEITCELTGVSITASSIINCNAETTLTAVPAVTGSPKVTYTWTIESGSAYAYFGTSGTTSAQGQSVTLTACNSTTENQSVTVKVTASDGTNSKTASHTITVNGTSSALVADEITGISVSETEFALSATGSTTLSAAASSTGSPSITYTWTITSGSAYAYFGTSGTTSAQGQSVTVTASNSTTESQTVTITVSASDGTNSKTATITITVGPGTGSTDTLYINLTSGTVSGDNSNWFDIPVGAANALTFTNGTLSINYTKSSGSSTGLVKIDAESFADDLTVNITGTAATGGVKIQTNSSYTTNVILNGASITSSNYPCLDITKGGDAVITLTGTNTLTDGRVYGTGYGDFYTTDSSLAGTYTSGGDVYEYCDSGSVQSEGSNNKGTIYCKGNLLIEGTGSVTITEAYKSCIAAKGVLTINGGTFNLTSTGKAGLSGDCAVIINDGSITFTGSGAVSSSACRKATGIKTNDSDDGSEYSSAYVTINGGSLNFTTSYGKGISAPVVTIAGGTHTITVKSPTQKVTDTSSSYLDANGILTTETVSFAPQGIDAGTVTVSGGDTTISAPWTGINSDGNITISDGTLDITTTGSAVYDASADDGCTGAACLKADGNILVTGGNVKGEASGEGSKGASADGTYSQSGGYIELKATASDYTYQNSSSISSSAKGLKIDGAITVTDGILYVKSESNEAIESKSTITISGGEVFGYSTGDDAINASGNFNITGGYVCGYSNANDGLDANGNMTISGGLVYAVCSKQPEVALDANTEEQKVLTINGGTIITLGPLESGAVLNQSCYKASSWSAGKTYGVTVAGTTYVITTPSSTSGYGSGMVVSGASTPTVTSGAATGGTKHFDAFDFSGLYEGGTAGNTSVSLSSYSSSSSSGPGGNMPGGR
ncbi:MAG: carbohydrate-binding domain-containing protein [Treponema sp.]|nr:carbohydrate-binding domain-containing protein [Treponema sp.]MBR0486993.1 carbohydrate-binding domain-containing protein [Treponema sp.]